MAYVVSGTAGADGLISVDFFADLAYEPNNKYIAMAGYYVIEEPIEYPVAPNDHTAYNLFINPKTCKWVYIPYEYECVLSTEEKIDQLISQINELKNILKDIEVKFNAVVLLGE